MERGVSVTNKMEGKILCNSARLYKIMLTNRIWCINKLCVAKFIQIKIICINITCRVNSWGTQLLFCKKMVIEIYFVYLR